MTFKDLFQKTDYTFVNTASADEREITALVTDTRRLCEGCLFFCIKGSRFDPHTKIDEIAEKAAVIVIETDVAYQGATPVVRVASSHAALINAARVFNDFPEKNGGYAIGVTGTNGKTSTTYFIESLLEAANRRAGVIGTIGARIGDKDSGIKFKTSTTPDTAELLEIFDSFKKHGAKDVVMEISSHAADQKRVDFLRFKAGVFTNLTQDHLDYHGDMERYFAAKARIFDFCEYAVINTDDEYGKRLAASSNCRVLTYGLNPGSDLQAVDIKYEPNAVEYRLKYLESYAKARVPIAGQFNVYNTLAAIGVGFALNIPMKTIMDGMANVKGIPGRIQSIPNTCSLNIIVDYAHTPDGLKEIIKNVRKFSRRVITVFGCGGDRDKTKRPLMGEIAGKLSDYCIITSDNPRSENPEDIMRDIEHGINNTNCMYEKVSDRQEAIERAINKAAPGDSVIIAGKGHEDYQEFADKTIYFDDAVTAKEILDKLQNKAFAHH